MSVNNQNEPKSIFSCISLISFLICDVSILIAISLFMDTPSWLKCLVVIIVVIRLHICLFMMRYDMVCKNQLLPS